MKFLIYPIVAIILTAAINSQEFEIPKQYIGLNLGLSQIFNNSSIPIIQGSSNCGSFSDGKSIGYQIGIIYYYPLLSKNLFISAGINYDSRPATLIRQNSEFEVLDPFSNIYTPLKREFVFNSSLKYITLDFGLRYKLPIDYPAFFRLFFDIGNPLVEKNYVINEQIISPDGVLFPDETRNRTISEGKLNTSTTAIGLNAAIQYQFELSNNLLIAPEISYRRGLNSILSESNWTMQSINLGVQIITDLPSEKKVKPETKEIEIPVRIEEEIIAEKPEKILPIIKSIKAEPIYFTETIVTQSYPLLPYIFFDSASSTLPRKYTNGNVGFFSEEHLPKSTINIYYRIMDIIGSRLRRNPKAIITIVGVTDGNELPTESERLNLAEQRAIAVKKYLLENWNLSQKQINISARNLPRLPTSTQYYEGFEENRRVEIYSDENNILAPVIHKHFFEYELLSNYISTEIDLNEYDGVKQKVSIYAANRELIIEKDFPAGSFALKIDEDIKERLIEELSNADELFAELTVNKDGLIENARFPIKLIKKSEEFEIGRLNLIVFDFDKADISEFNRQMITRFLTESIKPKSTIDIIGSTDRLGTDEYNFNLSRSRAMNVKNLIKSIIPNANFNKVEGIGVSSIYDNNLPEGRFYCRTVLIEIKTPVEK